MPELPEVETVRRQLDELLRGRVITGAAIHWRRTLGGQTPKAFALGTRGAHFTEAKRHGKNLLLHLQRGQAEAGVILAHLRMTGRFFVEPLPRILGKWDRLVIELDRTHALVFLDVRKFGRVHFESDAQTVLSGLGPDPLLSPFSCRNFAASLMQRRRALKPLLLDQSFVAGLGNIYTDEALHRAGLHPLRSAMSLSATEAGSLHAAILRVLKAALSKGGSSFDQFYRTPEGNPGAFQDEFRVYGRHGKACRACASTIQRAVLGQRGTWWCPQCQPTPARRQRSGAGFKD
ncbi:MAG: bifunctional DNA-formamidopyrimidine glycosylase/DNA-(apurinic or apyrimidinic site) lyase [Planctomycetes bacterium]|nr:bifunctional DNA-formamidopyrimidine glycosylase/DNA-(apurinic or apyrimidinic site) lyase [Planctomycetota bacterium]